MKRLLVCLALLVAACSGDTPTTPTSSPSSTVAPAASPAPSPGAPTADPPTGPRADAAIPQFSLTGPTAPGNCYTASASMDPMRWVLNVSDAGPRHLRFVALAHQEDGPGCEATTKNPRARIDVSGVTDYTPHQSGQTTFTFNPRMYNCGRVQVDVSIFDTAGNEILLIVAVINYGTVCTPPPNTLVCSPSNGTTPQGLPYTFTATGGSGTYSWSTVPAAGGTPSTGTGASFTQTYTVDGTYVATVTSGGQTASCRVTVQPAATTDVVCRPPTQTVQLNQAANVLAVFGNGVYAWSAPGGSPASGSGPNFSTAYDTPGTKTITVTSAGVTSNCLVTVPPPQPTPLVCAPPTQTVSIGQTATVNATGGTGTYAWAAPGGSSTSGTGSIFSTSYAAEGTNTITVTSGSDTATCQVVVPPPKVDPPVCAPPVQTVGINELATLTATAGDGTFRWDAPGGSVSSGTGATFTTSYAMPGTHWVNLTSGGVSTNCRVIVAAPTLVCAPSNQTVAVGAPAQMNATGGTGTYTWSAPGSQTPNGSGGSFTTTYEAEGSYTVTVTSGDATATCAVSVPPPPPLVCAPPDQTVNVGVMATMNATGGTGTYSWSAPGGSTAAGVGSTFSTSYASSGSYVVTVGSGAQTATCRVSVPQPPVNSCAGTNASILDLIQPTGTVRFTVPPGQVANFLVVVEDHRSHTESSYTFPNVPGGQTDVEVPVSCFPKVSVLCGTTVLTSARGDDLCPTP